MLYTRGFIIAFLLLASFISSAQTAFDSTLVINQFHKLGPLYVEAIRNAHSVKLIHEDGYKGVVESPRPNFGGEATFIFDVADNDSLINVYITEFWWYTNFREIDVKDYIVFVDENNMGFDQNKIKQHKLNPRSTELINFLFNYVRENKRFEVIKPRERNLKYQRVRFK